MKTPHCNLQIIPIRAVRLHEETDPARVRRIREQLLRTGHLAEPPLVAPMGNGQFVVLDGANRTTAFRQLRIPHLMVQVVPYRAPVVRLSTWNHLVCDPHFRRHWSKTIKRFRVSEPQAMLQFVNAYRGRYRFFRVTESSFPRLKRLHSQATCLVVFPKFQPRDIMDFARRRMVIPSGITRHLIAGRALNVNVPIAVLRGKTTLASKRRWLRQWLNQRIVAHQVRSYPESTTMFYD